MTVVFQLPASTSSDRDVLAFGCSPLAEACFALRVLVNPSRFRAHSGWVRSCRQLPAELRRELRELTPLFAHSVPGFLTATTSVSSSYEDELTRVATMRADEARAEVLAVLETWITMQDRRKDSALTASTVASTMRTTMRSQADALRIQWAQQPQDALDRLVALLERYWLAAFRSQWARLLPLLLSETRACADRVQRGLEFAPGSGVYLRDDSLTVRRDCRYVEQVVPAEKQVTLAPSSFLWPRVSVEHSPPWPLAVFYPLPGNQQRLRSSVAVDDLLPSLRALADGTRLRIIRLIIERPQSTQELAELVDMSEAAVSQHLRQLRAAGLVATKREGHYVLYSVERRSLRRIATALADLTPDDA